MKVGVLACLVPGIDLLRELPVSGRRLLTRSAATRADHSAAAAAGRSAGTALSARRSSSSARQSAWSSRCCRCRCRISRIRRSDATSRRPTISSASRQTAGRCMEPVSTGLHSVREDDRRRRMAGWPGGTRSRYLPHADGTGASTIPQRASFRAGFPGLCLVSGLAILAFVCVPRRQPASAQSAQWSQQENGVSEDTPFRRSGLRSELTEPA